MRQGDEGVAETPIASKGLIWIEVEDRFTITDS